MLDVSVEAPLLVAGGDVHGRVRARPGGSAANAAVWATAEGARARVFGRVGDDLVGRLVSESLAARGVDAAMAFDPSTPTGTMLVVHGATERSMVADRGANARLRAEDLPDELRAGAVLVSGYTLLHGGSRAAAMSALERARAAIVAVEASSWPLLEAVGADQFLADTRRATMVLANEREAEVLTGTTGADAARRLGERYPIACVKLGPRGAVVVCDERVTLGSAEATEEVDPTGAGDAFDGAFLAALAGGRAIEEALDRACRAGARVAASEELWPERGHR
jgi:ribokinase